VNVTDAWETVSGTSAAGVKIAHTETRAMIGPQERTPLRTEIGQHTPQAEPMHSGNIGACLSKAIYPSDIAFWRDFIIQLDNIPLALLDWLLRTLKKMW
jgi:hypothetical protein